MTLLTCGGGAGFRVDHTGPHRLVNTTGRPIFLVFNSSVMANPPITLESKRAASKEHQQLAQEEDQLFESSESMADSPGYEG